jgi:aquaporin Z
MFSATFFDMLIDYPNLFIHQHISSDIVRRFLIGLMMGLTALFIFNAPFGKKSGAYINPVVTIVRYRLGNIKLVDSIFYILFQFIGGAIGVYLAYRLFPHLISDPTINYIVTVPGKAGIGVAFVLEFLISFILIIIVLSTEKNKQLSKYTSYFVALLITTYITFEAPYSGMSMNPARTFASAIIAHQWKGFWIYCTAPLLGMWCGMLLCIRKTSTPL